MDVSHLYILVCHIYLATGTRALAACADKVIFLSQQRIQFDRLVINGLGPAVMTVAEGTPQQTIC